MKLIDKYIAKNVLSAIGLVTLMLAGLQIFIIFVNQLDDLGKGDYDLWQAALYVLFEMPYQVYLFFPMASLLGCLIGLGIMANNRELVIMRAAGMSIGNITLSILKVAFGLILVITLCGELFVPRLSLLANDQKMQALSGGQALRTAQGVWLRHKNDFISIGLIASPTVLEAVNQFHFDDEHHLKLTRKINRINLVNQQWIAEGIEETEINDKKTVAKHIQSMPWDVAVKPKLFSVGIKEPDEMTMHELRQYLRAQKNSHQNVVNYELAYWQRLIQPFTIVVMMILAIPFIFGPLRSSTMGSKLLIGAAVGFGFHIFNKFCGPLSQVFQWPAPLAAILPTFLFALLGLYLMKKAP